MEKRFEAYLREIKVDQAISHPQARQRFGISLKQAEDLGVWIETRTMTLNKNSYKPRLVSFHVFNRAQRNLSGTRLRHLAGTAAIRHLLGYPSHLWQSTADAVGKTHVPDAVCITPLGEVGIEFDAASYSPRKIRAKMRTFAADYPTGQVWGADSAAHVKRLEGLAAEVGVPVSVKQVLWLPRY